jgi:hypothetical protein
MSRTISQGSLSSFILKRSQGSLSYDTISILVSHFHLDMYGLFGDLENIFSSVYSHEFQM